MRRAAFILALANLALAAGPPEAPGGITFTDVTRQAGIRFVHNSGRAGQKWLPETIGSGVAFFDADGDGWADLLFVNGRNWQPGGRRTHAALYRNDGQGTFRDVTAGSGLDVELYGIGVAVGDYDNDGRGDVYLTALEGDRLFRNEGGGKFRDVTAASGIANASFGTSAAWVDYDRDGRLDVFVANYVRWTAKTDLRCSLDGATKSYCTPESYTGTASKLYRNLGAGRFSDESKAAGVDDPTSKSLGVTVLDYDGDGWPDLFVANDTQPNKLYRNNRNGTFSESGLRAGVAYSEEGIARGAMGVDAADYDRSGRPHLLVGNFSNQMLGLYHNEGKGLFVDEAPRSTVGRASSADPGLRGVLLRLRPRRMARHPGRQRPYRRGDRPRPAQGAVPAAASGLPQPRHAALRARHRLARRRLRPADRGARRGVRRLRPRRRPRRGAHHQPRPGLPVPQRWRQSQSLDRGHHRAASTSNRDGIGALVRIESGGVRQWQMVRSGSSYASQSDLTLTFGLGDSATPVTVEVEWPSGTRDRIAGVRTRQAVIVEEGRGLVPAPAPPRPQPPAKPGGGR